MPWSREQAHPLLTEWAGNRSLRGQGRRAIVVGCGLGADAEFVASLGFDTTAFDISPTAVRIAQERAPGTRVSYQAADVLHPPAQWRQAFDLVVELITVQVLPPELHETAIANIGGLVAPGGTLFVMSAIPDDREPPHPTGPWPLTRAELDAFATGDLQVVTIEPTHDPRGDRPPGGEPNTAAVRGPAERRRSIP